MSDDAELARLRELAAKPYRGVCQLCRFSLWFFDTEEEAKQKMTAHLATEHPNLVYWGATS